MSAREERLGHASGQRGKKLVIVVAIVFVVLAALVFGIVLWVSGDQSDPSMRSSALVSAAASLLWLRG